MDSPEQKQILFATHIGFVFIGIATVLPGPILPFLSTRFSLSDSQSGLFFIMQVAGSLISTALVGKLLDRFGFSRLLFAAFFFMATGIAGIGFFSWPGALCSIFLNGVGLGLTIPAINLMVAELNPNRSAAALNILNFAWGFGAMLCQPFVSLLSFKNSITGATLILAAILFLAGVWFLFFKNFSFSITQSTKSSDNVKVNAWRSPFAWLTLAVFFLYVGTETSIGGWITTYSLRLQSGTTHSFWTPATTLFWTALLFGRIAAPFFLRSVEETTLLLLSVLSATMGISLLLTTTRSGFILLSVCLIGIGLAPVFPTNMARFTNYFGAAARQNAGPLFIAATLGGAVITWFVGLLSTMFGSLRVGLFVSLFCSLLMIVFQLSLNTFNITNDNK